jgi:putative endonuclease
MSGKPDFIENMEGVVFVMSRNTGYLYILTNKHHTVLYIGVTNNLPARIIEHRDKVNPNSFTARYNVYKLVYCEIHEIYEEALIREKILKGGSRKRKIDLIDKFNSGWKDLFDDVQDYN